MSLLLVKLARRLKLKVIIVGQRMLSELDKKRAQPSTDVFERFEIKDVLLMVDFL